MAQLTSEFTFVGPIGNLSAYRIRGSDKVYLRRKGGASKHKINTAPQFEITRRQNAEFKGRAQGCKRIFQALHPLKALADYNMSGAMNALLKKIQEGDTFSEFGKRNIYLSASPKLMEGFSFNRIRHLETTLTAPLNVELSRENAKATVKLPEIVPGINFRTESQYPVYSFVLILGVVPDLVWSDRGYVPVSNEYDKMSMLVNTTDWNPCEQVSGESEIVLSIPGGLPGLNCALILAVGIRFGVMISSDVVRQVKYGCAKIVKAV